jgi:hypothetical protein
MFVEINPMDWSTLLRLVRPSSTQSSELLLILEADEDDDNLVVKVGKLISAQTRQT